MKLMPEKECRKRLQCLALFFLAAHGIRQVVGHFSAPPPTPVNGVLTMRFTQVIVGEYLH